jgi:hypothetical protein
MENFFNTLIYVMIKAFSNIVMGIAYLVLCTPFFIVIIEGFRGLNAVNFSLCVILGYIILIAGSMLKEHNEENNKPKS